MSTPRPTGNLRLLLCVSALVVLSALLLSPGEVHANSQPTMTTTQAAYNFAENTDATTAVATFVASDTDMDTLTWTLSGNDASDFAISSSGALTFNASPDFEDPKGTPPMGTDGDNTYEVTVEVKDGKDGSGMTDTMVDASLNVVVTVTNVNDAPTFDSLPADFSVDENAETTVAIATYTASDEDVPAQTLTWTLEGNDSGDFDIDSSTGALTFDSVPNYEMPAGTPADPMDPADNTYEVTVKVTDNGSPNLSAMQAITITVNDVNEAPNIDTTVIAYNFAENTEATTAVATFEATDPDSGAVLTWTLTGADADDFDIDANTDGDGVLTFKASPNFETPGGSPAMTGDPADNTYEVTIQVRDSKDADGNADTAIDDTLAVVVTVTNADDPGTVSISGTLEGGEELTAALTDDPDGPPSGQMSISPTWQWSRSDMPDGTFSNITNATSASYTSVAADVGKYLKATASYTDGEGSGKSADDVTDSAIAASNSEPTFDETDPATRAMDENTAANTNIGSAVSATDSDTGASLTYALTGTDAGSFDIDTSSGQLKTKSELDHETKGSYSVNVTVHDGLDAASDSDTTVDDTIAVTISVNDVNEAPSITTSDATRSVPENSTAVLTFEASDVDTDSGNTLTWSVESTDDGGKFSINPSTGALTFTSAPDFETPDDVGDTAGNNTYVVTVKVTDNGIDGDRVSTNHLSDNHTLTVTVTDVNETPVISGNGTPNFSEIEYDVGGSTLTTSELTIPGTYTFTDDDGDDVTWTLSGTDANHFQITKNMDGSSLVAFKNPTPSTTNKPADFENPVDGDTGNTYEFVVEATDDNTLVAPHNAKGTLNVTVTVTNVDETPEFTSGSATPSFAEIEYDAISPVLTIQTYTARDEEGETISWSIEGDDASDFSIDSMTGVLSFRNPPDFETPAGTPSTPGDPADNTYEVTVKATDGTASPNTDANAVELPVTVTVTDVNERPDIGAVSGDALQYTEVDFYSTDTLATVHTFTATDYDDGDTFTWSLSGDDAADFSISNEVGSEGALTFVQNDSLGFGPLPSYENPQDQDTDNVYSITVVATDDDSTPKAGQYAVTITVADKEEEGSVVVALPSDPPQVDDMLTFTLSDPDGEIEVTGSSMNWTIEARNPAIPPDPAGPWGSIDDDDPQSLSKTYTVNEDDTGKEFRATVSYTDRKGTGKMAGSDPTAAVVDERVVAPPRFRSGASLTIPEGEAGTETVEMITATDRDGEALIFGLTGQNSDLFEIIPSPSSLDPSDMGNPYIQPLFTARLRSVDALDYEDLSESERTMSLTLTLSDGRGESNGTPVYDDLVDIDDYAVTITVTNVDEDGAITLSPEEVPEPGVELTATLEDPDGNVSGESWQWQRSEDAEADTPVWDDISGAASNVYTPSATNDVISGGNHDGKGYYLRTKATYDDGQGTGKTAHSIAQRMGTSNTSPSFPSTETGQRSVPENSSRGTNIGSPVAATDPESDGLTYLLEGEDAELFQIVSSTGQIRVKEPLDYEQINGYMVTVRVHDRKDAAGASSTTIDDTQDVQITVTNVDEDGEVSLSTPTNRIQTGVPVTATLTDPDGGVSGLTWQWARSGDRSNWTDIATGETYTPTQTDDEGNYLRATASYTDGEGTGKTADAATSRVAQAPPANAAPVFPDAEDGRREVAENSGQGTLVGDPVTATDLRGGHSPTQ